MEDKEKSSIRFRLNRDLRLNKIPNKKYLRIDKILEESNGFLESKYFQNFIKLIAKIKEEDKYDFKYDQLVCHCLRSFTISDHCRQELYFLIALQKYFNIKHCKIIAHVLDPKEVKMLKILNFDVINVEDSKLVFNRFKINSTEDGKTLVYMSPFEDRRNEIILQTNWNLNFLNNLHLICYSFNKIIKENFKNDKIIRPHSFVFNSSRKLNIVKEYKIEYLDKKEFDHLTLHKFSAKNLNEETIQTYYYDYKTLFPRYTYNKMKENNPHYYLEQSNKLKETVFFDKFLKSFNAFKRLLNDDFKFDRIICYAFGNFGRILRSEYILAFLICLKNYLNIDCEIDDPTLEEDDKKMLIELNFKLINANEDPRTHVYDKKTLFFVYDSHIIRFFNAIFKYNWNLKSLDNLYFICFNDAKSKNPYSEVYSKVYRNIFKIGYESVKIDLSTRLIQSNANYRALHESLKVFKKFNFEPTNDYRLGPLNYMSLNKIDVSNITQDDLNKHLERYPNLNGDLRLNKIPNKKYLRIGKILEESNGFLESKYFQNFIKLIAKIKEEDKYDFKYDQLVCHCLRSFTISDHCRQELYFLIALQKYFNIKNCKIIAHVLDPKEVKILKILNFDVINVEDSKLVFNRFKINSTEDGKTLVYMSPFEDRRNEIILQKNWNLNFLNNLHLICYSFNKIIKENFKNDKIVRPHSFVFNSSRKLNIVKEYKIEYLFVN